MTRTRLRIIVGILVAALALYAPYFNQVPENKELARVLYFAIAAMGLNLLTGFNGQISIGHGALFGVGAFTTAVLMNDHGVMFEATIPAAALVAAFIGVLVGIPALRVRGLYLALVTLGLAVLFPRVILKYIGSNVRPPRREFDSLLQGVANDQWVYLECLVIAVVLFFLAWNLTRSRMGRAMVAVRDQELAASTVGINLARVKVVTFGLSAAYAGVAGSLSVLVEKAADATDQTMAFRNSIEFLVAVVIGGTATIAGPAVGAFILIGLRRETESLITGKEILSPAVFGAALIAVVFLLPEGVVGGIRKLTDRVLPDGGGGGSPPLATATAGGAGSPDTRADGAPPGDPPDPSPTKEHP